ncbi:hypothetical protein JGH11_15235 [Dysgonomonas sp. Marseille-P4677]|uniref:hypothetical protein n=1 Tax=Dysgonomonas sp. Marseille-P4677 TaxID=2364790 RepID=UPI001914CD88|nr:hypothetical protein [Dysgonomonas sp. Marseille-P4677]MBK5722228.1 hypothetical protein [Dysgonomonas sp. Marseille-P4677]
MKKKDSNYELLSLNGDLQNEFTIQTLELRLETDPLFLGSFFQEMAAGDCNQLLNCTAPMALTVCSGNHHLCTAAEALY